MTTRRWWDVAFASSVVVLALLAWANTDFGDTARIGAIATLGAMGIFYAGFGRRAFPSGPSDTADEAAAQARAAVASLSLRAAIIIGAGVAAAFAPNMATFQAIAFPLIWALTDRYLRAVTLSGVLAVSVGIGFYIGLGSDSRALLSAVVIEAISFTFAVALGTWITRIADEGQKQRQLFQDLAAAQDELAAMHREAGTVAERERLAREIHDTIAQSLTSLVMLAQRSHRELADVPDQGAVAATATVDLIESTARDALTDARSLVASMARVSTENSTLTDTIHRLGERFEKETGIQVSVSVAPFTLERELEVVLLRCTQEALANVRKHSRASAASVSIAPAGTEVALEVRDNGRGIADASAGSNTDVGAKSGSRSGAEFASQPHSGFAAGFGIDGMRDRVGLVGGRLELTSGPSGGTLVRVTLPNSAPQDPPTSSPGAAPPAPPITNRTANRTANPAAGAAEVPQSDSRETPVHPTGSIGRGS